MKTARTLFMAAFGAALVPAAYSQVPDLLTALDAGGRAMGMGGANYVTGADTLSSYNNPAGLGYLNRKEIGLSIRNMPESRTFVTGDLVPSGSERLDSTGKTGPNGLGHLGFVLPLRGGKQGTVGVALTAGGQMRDERFAGAGLTEGGVVAPNYAQLLKNKTDFVSLSYGKAMDAGFNFGFGLLYARNNTVNNRVGVPSGPTLYDEQSSGYGFIAGVQFAPRNMPNLAFGASYRSEISLHSNSGNTLIYDKIPAKLAGGVALRQDGLRHGNDFVVLGAEVAHYFSGTRGVFFDRDTQTVFGLGMEYNYSMGGARIPIRVGYNFDQAGGFGFGDRNVFTYGIGYRPNNADWAIDANFGRPSGGGSDFGLNLSYRFK